MITAKIGGTSVTASNLRYLNEIITPYHNCLVVSAIGKEYVGDVKTTDLLQRYFYTRSAQVWDRIADKYRRLVQTNGINVDIDKLLYDARRRAEMYDVNYCMSLGEELSARTVAAYMSAQYIEAADAVAFCKGKLQYGQTYARIRRLFGECALGVVGGFYGGDVSDDGCRCTLPRGGGDVSGALFAHALGSSLYENWTDVYGVCVANPVKVFDAATVPNLSYAQMLALANAGAEVLHPNAIYPVRQKAIPIKIGNFTNPRGADTLVCNCPCRSKLLSVAERSLSGGSTVTTILHNCAVGHIMRVIADFLHDDVGASDCLSHGAESVAFGRGTVRIVTDRSVLCALYRYLSERL